MRHGDQLSVPGAKIAATFRPAYCGARAPLCDPRNWATAVITFSDEGGVCCVREQTVPHPNFVDPLVSKLFIITIKLGNKTDANIGVQLTRSLDLGVPDQKNLLMWHWLSLLFLSN